MNVRIPLGLFASIVTLISILLLSFAWYLSSSIIADGIIVVRDDVCSANHCSKRSPSGTAVNIKNYQDLSMENLDKSKNMKEIEHGISKKINALQVKLKKDPKNEQVLSELGTCFLAVNKPESAIGLLKIAVKISERNPKDWYNLGLAQYRIHNYIAAIQSYNKALNLKPAYTKARYNLGVVYLQMGENIKARDVFLETLKYDKSSGVTKTYFQLAFTLGRLGELKGAIKEYKEAIRLKPDYIAARFNLAITLIKLGYLQEAIAELDKLIKLGDNSAKINYLLARTHEKLGEIDLAIEYYRKAMKLGYNIVKGEYSIGLLLYNQKKYQQSINAFKMVLKKEPENWRAMYHISQNYQKLKDTSNAKRYAASVLKIQPEHTISKKILYSNK